MVLSTEWSQVEVIDLLNDGNGLGFILVGGKSTGVVIKALTPGGIAERDGRMQCGDHVLQIGEVNLRGFSSEQAATVLRQMGAQVRLIVARPVEPTSPDYQALASHAPIIPTKLLTDPEELERQLVQTAAYASSFFSAQEAMLQAAAAQQQLNDELTAQQLQQQQFHQQQQLQQQQNPNNIPAAQSPLCSLNVQMLHSPLGADGGIYSGYDSESSTGAGGELHSLAETDVFDVVLHRNVYGLGIRVAGYVCEEEDLSGIFVKSMVEGGAGEAGRVRINDRILAVDGKSVAEATNHEAVTLLKNSGISVHLRIERFLRGRKYEHLQVALNDMKEVNIATTSSITMTTSTATVTTSTTTTPATAASSIEMDAFLAPSRIVGSDTMTSMAQLSLPPSPSCATLTWVAPKSDADSLATVDIDYPDVVFDEKQIEAEFESHTTIDSDVFVVHYNTNGSKTPSCSSATCSSASASHDVTPAEPPATAVGNELFPCPPIRKNTNSVVSHKSKTSNNNKTTSHHRSTFSPTICTTNNISSFQQAAATTTKTAATTTTPVIPTTTPADYPIADNNVTSAATISTPWANEYANSTIIVAQLNKLAGLGISLEGTVDVEGGIEKRPHHFIRSILDDGPVATEGSFRPGDEILQVNEHRLQGLKHTDVVKILKELPAQVRMVCARGPSAPSVINTSQNLAAFQSRSILPGGLGPRELMVDVMLDDASGKNMMRNSSGNGSGSCNNGHTGSKSNGVATAAVSNVFGSGSTVLHKAQSESSLYTSSSMTAEVDCAISAPQRSRSVEQVSGLALWSSDVVYVDLIKTDYGFGFSVLDYQDPLDVDGTVIVVRGLIPGGAAESSQQLFPGDRIVSVGDIRVQGKTLDEAVEVLKGMPLGVVQIGLCRPLCVSDDSSANTPT